MKEFSAHLRTAWWRYAVVAVAAIVLWTSVFDLLAKPDANEKLTVSYFGDSCDGAVLDAKLKAEIGQITGQRLEAVTFENIPATGNAAVLEQVQTRLYSADILIFEDGVVTEELIVNSFRPMPEELVQQLAQAEIYEVGGLPYGVKLPKTSRFGSCYGGEKNCVALFAPYGVNLGAAYGAGNASDCGAIDLLNYLLENTNGESESE